LSMVQHPAGRGALAADVTMQIVGVPRELLPLKRERAENVVLRIVEYGSIERDYLAQGLSDCAEQRLPREIRDDRVVDLQKQAILPRLARVGGWLLGALFGVCRVARPVRLGLLKGPLSCTDAVAVRYVRHGLHQGRRGASGPPRLDPDGL